MPFFEYFAAGPLANWIQLNSGPGAVPLFTTSGAYMGAGEALDSAATGADGLTNAMATAWGGMSSQKAQSAFRKHTVWVREQAAVARQISILAARAGEAHLIAVATMPTLAEIIANMVKRAAAATAAAADATALTTALVAQAELEYLVLRLRAATAMGNYEAAALDTLVELAAIPLVPPPPIALPGGGAGDPQVPDTSGPLLDLVENGPNSEYMTSDSRPLGDGPQSTNNGTGEGPQSTGDGPQSVGDTTDPTDLAPGESPAEQAISELQQVLSPDDPLLHSGDGGGFDPSTADSLLGTSPYSSTLAGMAGGVGAFTALGMTRGGLGAMPGAATGFRMPGGWAPGTGTAFGASTGAPAGAPVRNTPRRVTAPTARMRRRREEEENRPGKVFTPGEQMDVPVLERPPAIGVIEYDEDEFRDDVTSDAVLVGVLDRLDDDAETDGAETPR